MVGWGRPSSPQLVSQEEKIGALCPAPHGKLPDMDSNELG